MIRPTVIPGIPNPTAEAVAAAELFRPDVSDTTEVGEADIHASSDGKGSFSRMSSGIGLDIFMINGGFICGAFAEEDGAGEVTGTAEMVSLLLVGAVLFGFPPSSLLPRLLDIKEAKCSARIFRFASLPFVGASAGGVT
jgi:hypothetical protein